MEPEQYEGLPVDSGRFLEHGADVIVVAVGYGGEAVDVEGVEEGSAVFCVGHGD